MIKKTNIRGVVVGTGYFSHFHLDAWQKMEQVEILAICDLDGQKAAHVAAGYGIKKVYQDAEEMLVKEKPDFIDIVTAPDTHWDLSSLAISYGIHIICQKPVAPTFKEAEQLFELVNQSKIRFMVHENWRHQPWYRQIKYLLDQQAIGNFHTVNFRMRMGDGWSKEAYLDRQPYFRTMPRLLIHETGVHFIDTFRYLFGEIESVYARLRKLNPAIRGEDTAWVQFDFASGGLGFYDASRYNESTAKNPRYTFGECLIEGSTGTLRLHNNGQLTLQKLGEQEQTLPYHHSREGFMGDCVYACQHHFIECLINNKPFETAPDDYYQTLKVQEAIYQSGATKSSIKV